MKSIGRYLDKISSKNKRGNLNITSDAVVGVGTLVFLVFAIFFGISVLNPSSFFATASLSQNATNDLNNNFTVGVSQFSAYLPSAFKIFAVILILGALALLFIFLARMRQTASAGNRSGGF